MKFKVYSTRSIDIKKIEDSLFKAKNYLFPLPIEFSPVSFIEEKDDDKSLYNIDWASTLLKMKEIRAIKDAFIYSLPHGGYDGVILFLNKDKALEESTLYGQHTNIEKEHLIQCYISDRYVRLRKKGDKYVEDYTKTPKDAMWEADSHALIHEIMHAYSYFVGLKDQLHDYVKKGEFESYKNYLLSKIITPADLLPLVRRKSDVLIATMASYGLPIRITEGYRSFKRQNEIYAQGRTRSGTIVTNAKAGESLHNFGVAADLCFKTGNPYPALNDPKWQTLFDEAEKLGFQCYGRLLKWDYPHIQLLLEYTEDDFRKGRVDYAKFT